MSPPLPVEGLKPPQNPPDRTQTGEMRAIVEPLLKEHDNKLTFRSVLVAVGSVIVATVTALVFIDNRVQAGTDAGVKVHESRIIALEQQVPQLRQEVFDARSELRELYKAVVDKKRSAVLEQPVPQARDGGPQ